MKLLGLGDNVMDAYLFRGELYPGGNAANVAVLAKRAGAEKSGYIGVLATDAAGEHFRTVLQAENVDISRLRRGVQPATTLHWMIKATGLSRAITDRRLCKTCTVQLLPVQIECMRLHLMWCTLVFTAVWTMRCRR